MKKMPVLLFIAACLIACLIITAGCTQSSPTSPAGTPVSTPSAIPTASITPVPTTAVIPSESTIPVSDNTITIMNDAFSPTNLTVKVGSTVRWVNGDDHPHRIEFASKAFSTSTYLLGASQSFSQVFSRPGTYDYDCMIYSFMHGTITVVE